MARAFVHGRLSAGQNTSAHHEDHAKCRLGMAAYWLLTLAIGPVSNDHRPPTCRNVSTKPWSDSRQGGISGKKAKPMSARPVVNASVLRHSGYRALSVRNSHTMATMVTMKWALP